MEKWREDVLIHYGVKGMKWGKRSKSFIDAFDKLSEDVRTKRDLDDEALKRWKEYRKLSTSDRGSKKSSSVTGIEPAKDSSLDSDIRSAKKRYDATKGASERFDKKVKQGQKNLFKETANERLRMQKERRKEDNTYKVTDADRKRYKKQIKRNKTVDFFAKYGIKLKRYK